jgi:hypothetical protein
MPKLKTKALAAARKRLEAARDAFTQACEDVVAQLDCTPVERALREWWQAAAALTETARALQDDAQTYYDERSEKWQHSDRDQACADWMHERETLADFDAEPTEAVCITVDVSEETPTAALETDPSAVFPDIPDLPEMGG